MQRGRKMKNDHISIGKVGSFLLVFGASLMQSECLQNMMMKLEEFSVILQAKVNFAAKNWVQY